MLLALLLPDSCDAHCPADFKRQARKILRKVRQPDVITTEGDMTTNPELLKRITARPEVFGGKPIIRDMRISVELILSLLTQGVTTEAILEDYPELEPDDIRACTAYAHAVIAKDSLASVSIADS